MPTLRRAYLKITDDLQHETIVIKLVLPISVFANAARAALATRAASIPSNAAAV
jgi:hypothetical protein